MILYLLQLKLKDYNSKLIQSILKLTNKNTAIIPTMYKYTILVDKFFIKIMIKNKEKYFRMEEYNRNDYVGIFSKKTPNHIIVKHIQRGYPLKPLNKKMSKKANKLRNAFKVSCKSPKINNIYSEFL